MTNADTNKLKAEIQELDQRIDDRLASILARLEELAKTEKVEGLGEDILEVRVLCQQRSFKKSLETRAQSPQTENNNTEEIKERKARVLCVEDDDDSGYMMRALLDEYGYEAVIATSVAGALELAKAGGFALFILDNWFEQSSGVTLCEHIRTFDANTPILFYSGAGSEADIQAGMNAGAQGYLIKPDLEHLRESIARLIAGTKAKKQTG